MKIETWFYLKEINGALKDRLIHEVLMYKGNERYLHLVVESSGEGYESIANFPYRIYKTRSEAMARFRKLKYVNYRKRTEEDGGMNEHSINVFSNMLSSEN